MDSDGCKAGWVGVYTPIGKEGTKNKGKRSPNGRDEDFLGSMNMVKSSRQVTTMDMVFVEDHVQEFRDNEWCTVCN